MLAEIATEKAERYLINQISFSDRIIVAKTNCSNLVTLFAVKLEALLSKLQGHVKSSDWASTRELDLLERLRLLVHQVYNEGEAAV